MSGSEIDFQVGQGTIKIQGLDKKGQAQPEEVYQAKRPFPDPPKGPKEQEKYP